MEYILLRLFFGKLAWWCLACEAEAWRSNLTMPNVWNDHPNTSSIYCKLRLAIMNHSCSNKNSCKKHLAFWGNHLRTDLETCFSSQNHKHHPKRTTHHLPFISKAPIAESHICKKRGRVVKIGIESTSNKSPCKINHPGTLQWEQNLLFHWWG